MNSNDTSNSISSSHPFTVSTTFWRNALIMVVAMAAVMRLVDLGNKSIWFDETHTFNDAFREYVWFKLAHALYFQIVKLSILIGGMSDFWLRLPSALFGVLGVYLIYLMTVEIFDDRRAGLMSSLFTCFSITHLDYSQEARYYAAIFFWSTLTVYFLARFFRRRSFSSLILLPIVCLMNYFTHPVTLVLSGVALGWCGLGLMATSQGRSILKSAYDFVRGTITRQADIKNSIQNDKPQSDNSAARPLDWARWGRLALLAAGLIIIGVGIWQIAAIILPRIKAINWFQNPVSGVEWSWDFFYTRHFLPFGPGERVFLNQSNPVTKFLIGCYVILAIAGYGWALARRWLFGTLAIVTVALSFSLLFSLGYSQYHHYKYLFFLFPMHIACMMYGLSALAAWAGRLASRKSRVAAIALTAVVLATFWFPNAVQWSKSLIKYYTWERSGAKPALKAALREFNPESDYIAAYGVTTWVMEYYARQWNIPSDRLIGVLHEKGDGSHMIARMRRAAREGGRVWFIDTWRWDMKPLLLDWVKENFSLSLLVPSYLGPDRDVTLWEWKYAGRTVSSRLSINIVCPVYQPGESPKEDGDGPGVFFNYLDRDCFFSVHPFGSESVSTGTLILHINGSDSLTFRLPSDFSRSSPPAIMVPPGMIHMWGEFQPDLKESAEAHTITTVGVSISPVNKDLIQYRATAFDTINPMTDYISESVDESINLELPFNNTVTYNFDVPDSGQYHVGLRGIHDAPGPILFQVDIDDKPHCFLSFKKADQSIDTLMFPAYLAKGRREVRFSFVSDYSQGTAVSEESDNNAILRRVFIEKIRDGQKVIDNRARLPREKIVDLKPYVSWPPLLEGKPEKVWKSKYFDSPRIETIHANGIDYPSFTGMMTYETDDAQLLSPAIPMNPGDYIYFSIKVRTVDMLNHVANVMVGFADASGEIFRIQIINGQGVYETADQVLITALTVAPPETAYGVISLLVYSRGHKVFRTPGQVWYYDFRHGLEMLDSMQNSLVQSGAPQ